MAFGVITNTLLVGLLGVPPAIASQRVHIVECVTTASSAISHLLQRNIDRKLFFRLLISGVIGTVNSVEFFLTVSVSIAFLFHLGIGDFVGATVGLIVGGVVAAPFGAIVARRVSAKVLLIFVGFVLSATSAYGIYSALS